LDEGTSLVVSPDTTDEQIESLLWFIREKVRSHRFRDLGITQPTTTDFKVRGYLSGGIFIYRGEKCANEGFSDYKGGQCYGKSEAGDYQWGFFVDRVQNPDFDSAVLNLADGNGKAVFDYKDHWQLPAELQQQLDAEKKEH